MKDKIIQAISHRGDIYVLTSEGEIYVRYENFGTEPPYSWVRIESPKLESLESTGYFISCLKADGLIHHFEVPPEVYNYIKQLEGYIKFPEESKLKEVYAFRFK